MKSDDRRAAILGRLADYVLAEGLGASSLRPLAKAAGISDRMLLYYFKDKTEVLAAVLEQIVGQLAARLNEAAGANAHMPLDALCAKLTAILLADDLWPYMRLWLEIAALAAREDAFYRDLGERIARGFWLGASQLESPSPQDREADAVKLLVMMEGMVLLKSVGLDDVRRQAL